MATVKNSEPRVQIILPPMMDEGSGIKMDNTEHVTINGVTTIIRRGEYVEVPISVFEVLKIKYPNL